MNLTLLLSLTTFVGIIGSLVFYMRAQKDSALTGTLVQENNKLLGKVSNLKKDLNKTRDLEKKSKNALLEAKKMAQKRLKRLSQKSSDAPDTISAPSVSETNVERLQNQVRTLSTELSSFRNESNAEKDALKASMEENFDIKKAELLEDINKLKDEMGQIRGQRKASLKTLPVDLDSLPKNALNEMARLFRKAEQHERLHNFAQNKIKLAQEKYAELQKRYFAVCREFAIAASGNKAMEDLEARDVAEAAIMKPAAPTPEAPLQNGVHAAAEESAVEESKKSTEESI